MVGDVRSGSFLGNLDYLGAMGLVVFPLPFFDSDFWLRSINPED